MENRRFSSVQELEQDIERVELEILCRAATELDALRNAPGRAEECRRLKRIIQRSLVALKLDKQQEDGTLDQRGEQQSFWLGMHP